MNHDEIIISAASKSTITGAATTVVGAVSNMDLLTVVGVLVAIGGFLINLIFQLRRDRREHKEHLARMAHLRVPVFVTHTQETVHQLHQDLNRGRVDLHRYNA